jgi:uncharacterized protein (DUF3084 family)
MNDLLTGGLIIAGILALAYLFTRAYVNGLNAGFEMETKFLNSLEKREQEINDLEKALREAKEENEALLRKYHAK